MCIGFRHRFCRIQTYWFLSKKSINERTLFLSASQLINVPKDFAWTTHRFHFPRCTQPWGTKSSYSSARTACVISRIYLQKGILSTCARMRIHLFQYISYLYLKYICMYTYIVDLQGMVTCFFESLTTNKSLSIAPCFPYVLQHSARKRIQMFPGDSSITMPSSPSQQPMQPLNNVLWCCEFWTAIHGGNVATGQMKWRPWSGWRPGGCQACHLAVPWVNNCGVEAQSMPLTSRVIDFSVDGKSSPLHCDVAHDACWKSAICRFVFFLEDVRFHPAMSIWAVGIFPFKSITFPVTRISGEFEVVKISSMMTITAFTMVVGSVTPNRFFCPCFFFRVFLMNPNQWSVGKLFFFPHLYFFSLESHGRICEVSSSWWRSSQGFNCDIFGPASPCLSVWCICGSWWSGSIPCMLCHGRAGTGLAWLLCAWMMRGRPFWEKRFKLTWLKIVC